MLMNFCTIFIKIFCIKQISFKIGTEYLTLYFVRLLPVDDPPGQIMLQAVLKTDMSFIIENSCV